MQVRDNFRNALVSQPELLEGTKLHTMVTVVDGSTFLEEFQSFPIDRAKHYGEHF